MGKFVKFIRVWLDDERKPLPGYDVWFRDNVAMLPRFVVDHCEEVTDISFDNSLGLHNPEGHVLLNELEDAVCAGGVLFPRLEHIWIHTSDSNMRKPMMQAACNIFKHTGNNAAGRYRFYGEDLDRLRLGDDWLNKPFPGVIY